MAQSLPKLDPVGQKALLGLRNYAGMIALTKHLADKLAYTQNLLVTANPADVPILQGKAQELQATLKLLTEE